MPTKRKNPAAVALGARGGKSGRGDAKRRGDADYYRRLVALRGDRGRSGMRHRHLAHQDFTLAAIDDVIGRGGFAAWTALRQAVIDDPVTREKVRRICAAHHGDPSAQRYRFWSLYAAPKTAA